MKELNTEDALALMGWSKDHIARGFPDHPDWPLRALYRWENTYIGDLHTIVSFSMQLFLEAQTFIHWTSFLGWPLEPDFEDLILKGLLGVLEEKSDNPLIIQFSNEEKGIMIGNITHRMACLGDHLLLVPDSKIALGFTNDGEALLYSREVDATSDWVHSLCSLGYDVEKLPT